MSMVSVTVSRAGADVGIGGGRIPEPAKKCEVEGVGVSVSSVPGAADVNVGSRGGRIPGPAKNPEGTDGVGKTVNLV